ncbi:MAG: PilZ domain-containing protein [Deltaproteobacteria bacterium]|nr:PilZ domain-containing protein [Deltaproteobacteria bacterium]
MMRRPAAPTPIAGERRANPRIPVVVREAQCRVGIDVFFGCAVNVGRGGLFISSVRPRHPGEVHEIQFEVPGLDRIFRCRARVVWSRRYAAKSSRSPGFGLQFLDLPQEDRRALEAWVERERAAGE